MSNTHGTDIRPRFVSMVTARQYLGGVSDTVFREMLNRKEIESRYVGARRMVILESLEAYADSRSEQPPAD